MSLRDNLSQDAVKALRILDVVEVSLDATISTAITLMQEKAVGCVFITKRHKPIGVFTERDVLTKVLARELALDTPIEDVMTRNPQVIDEHCSVTEVIRKMNTGGFRNMPVVDAEGQCVGTISVKRIVQYLVEHFPETVFNLPPDPAQRQLAREGA